MQMSQALFDHLVDQSAEHWRLDYQAGQEEGTIARDTGPDPSPDVTLVNTVDGGLVTEPSHHEPPQVVTLT